MQLTQLDEFGDVISDQLSQLEREDTWISKGENLLEDIR